MALTTSELEFLSVETRRILKPGGLNIYTVRHTGNADFRTGTHRGGDMYEVGGFIVHFFSKDKVRNLAEGYQIIGIDEFEESSLPRKLFRVPLKKEGEQYLANVCSRTVKVAISICSETRLSCLLAPF